MDEWYVFEYAGTAGERCDAAVTVALRATAEFATLSRARIQALIEQGGVLFDGKEVTSGWKNLRPGMRIEVNLTRLRELVRPLAPEHVEPVDLPLQFLHVDQDIAVVVKPAGLTVHPSATEEGPTLSAALIHHLGELSDHGGADRPGIVHRLDKETSGLLVVARNNTAHAALSRQFASRLVDKEYLALCIDQPSPPAGSIDLPIDRHPAHRQKMWADTRFNRHGREALTEYRVREAWGPFTLLDVAIHTGRTHQIRVHLLTAGAVILGDDKYGAGRNGSLRAFLKSGVDQTARRTWRSAWPDAQARAAMLAAIEGYPGIFLHARRLAFTHPLSGERLEFTLPPPAAWDEVQRLCQHEGPPE